MRNKRLVRQNNALITRTAPVVARLVALALAAAAAPTTAQAQARGSAPAKPAPAKAAPAAAEPAAPEDAPGAERVNVDAIKERYWARGDESELGVVQNRLYSKARKWELGAFGGFFSSDPFLTVRGYGGSVGYHFNEYFAVRAVGAKLNATGSSARTTLEGGANPKRASTNEPRSWFAAEAVGSLLYGKLSVVGRKIIYYDFHLLGGAGRMATENGNYMSAHLGLGQQFYLAKWVSLAADYRIIRFREEILNKDAPVGSANYLRSEGFRNNYTHTITLGLTFLIGGGE